MRIQLVTFGKLKTPGLREAADYYKKLVSSWVKFEEIELKPLKVSEKDPSSRKVIQEKEGLVLLEKLSQYSGPFYLLDEGGKERTTRQWAEEVSQWENRGISCVSFCVGSSLGFSAELRRLAKGSFSLGPQTLPHELARVVVIEQLYRAWSVVRGHPYHNEGN